MQFTLTAQLDNAAMQDEAGEPDPGAIACMLMAAAADVQQGISRMSPVYDVNGNQIGTWSVTTGTEE